MRLSSPRDNIRRDKNPENIARFGVLFSPLYTVCCEFVVNGGENVEFSRRECFEEEIGSFNRSLFLCVEIRSYSRPVGRILSDGPEEYGRGPGRGSKTGRSSGHLGKPGGIGRRREELRTGPRDRITVILRIILSINNHSVRKRFKRPFVSFY